jgi:hypothetical protein
LYFRVIPRCGARPRRGAGYRWVRALGVAWLSMREGCRCGEARCRGDPRWAPASGTRAERIRIEDHRWYSLSYVG